ncbi:hypothetical protein [Fodinicurvata sp. EGI_FJ10296]|uniref:hypothetical protein n=1 Tax=Fodinicurvata sp. EGI_FJ10296 TaxID=3231908 RepID=UPI0034567548
MNPQPYKDSADWIERSRIAAEKLMAEHRFRSEDFVTVTEAGDVEPCDVTLDIDPGRMPLEWGEYVRRDEDGTVVSGWVREDCIPIGLTIFWPDGLDCCGEAHDAADPEYLLSDVEAWENLTDDEMRALCEGSAA